MAFMSLICPKYAEYLERLKMKNKKIDISGVKS